MSEKEPATETRYKLTFHDNHFEVFETVECDEYNITPGGLVYVCDYVDDDWKPINEQYYSPSSYTKVTSERIEVEVEGG